MLWIFNGKMVVQEVVPIKIERKIYPLEFKQKELFAFQCSIFIQANSVIGEHCYYLLDFKRNQVISWTFDIRELKERLQKSVESKRNVQWKGYSLNFLDFSLMAHTAIYNMGYIYITSINSNYIIRLSIYDDTFQIIEDAENPTKLYSSTNAVIDNEIYFTRYDLFDKINNLNYESDTINNDICKYNINSGKFSLISCFERSVTMHQTSITQVTTHITFPHTKVSNYMHTKLGETRI